MTSIRLALEPTPAQVGYLSTIMQTCGHFGLSDKVKLGQTEGAFQFKRKGGAGEEGQHY